MAVKDAAPEDVASLPQDFAVPTYNANNQPLYDNQLFPAVKSVEDLVARGYATPDGQVTENGQMALSLKKVGALNDDYTLNDTGRAVLSKREDLLELDNLSLYGKAEELNLDDDGRGMGERFSAGVKELWKSTQDLGAALYEEAEPIVNVVSEVISTPEQQILRGQKEVGDISENVSKAFRTPEQKAATRIRTEEAIKEFSDQSVATLLGAGELIARATAAGPFPIAQRQLMALTNAANKDEAVLITRQARERILNDVANVGVAEAVDQLTGVTEFVKSYQQAAELLGPEATQEKIAQGKAMGLAGSILNPATPEAAAFGAAFKVARGVTAPISGALLRSEQKAQRVLAKTKDLTALQKQAAEYQLTVKAIEQQAARAEDTAAKLSQRGFVDRANSATTSANALRRKAQEASVRFGGLQDEITRVSDDLATLTKDATVADKFNQMMQKAKEVPYMPITMVGSTLEYVGRNMIGIDKGLSKLASKIGVDKAYNAMNKISSLSGLGTVGAAAGLGPAAFIPAAIKTAWSTAPFIEGAGKFINLVGKEAMKSRADINFWKRIYEMPNQGPVNRAIAGLMDTATLGGRVTDLGVRTTKGVLAAVPADLAFQYVAEGGKMDAGSIGEALSEAVFFGGAGGGLGAITMGSKQKIRSLQNGNALNFYRTLEDPQQRVMFNGMPEDYRRAIGTFSATNPGARVMFTTIGGGGIDPNTNTIYINPNSSNPIKPLVTHEFMHHMMNNGIGEGIVAQLVGDGYQTGGILRTADGKYEPQYEAFKEEYVDRLRQQHAQMIKMREAIGDKIHANEREFQAPSEKYLAEEYFIESNVEDMLGLVESGKFGKMAGRMIINDKVRALGDSILNKSSILRDLHFKLGGVMDKNGKMVSGNGFLGGQMYQSPEIRRMFKKMVSDSVGRKGGFDQARVKAKEGVKLKINGKTDPILKSMVSFWEGDADGVPFLDKDGDFIPLKKETEEMRATAGLLLIDDQNRRQANGETIAEGQLVYNPDTQTWSGKYLTEDQIRILRLSGRFNNPQIRQLEMLNEAAKATLDPNAAPETRGNRFSIIYQAALKRNKKGKWRYDQIEPSLRDVVPYGVEITKNGNILIRIMSTNQMHANISKKAASKKGVQLYDGNIEAILRDVNKVIELHGEADGKPTDAHFKEKYGAAWESHKAFINSVFGNVGAGHKDINPLVASDKVDAVVKTYRLDRINKATQMVGSTNLPYQNNLVKINYLPEGEPILDENGEPKDLRYTPSYEDSQVRMPEAQRAMPEGISPEDLNPVANKQEAQGLWADGKRMFALNEMDENLTPITSKAMLDSYSADAIGWMEPQATPAGEQTGQMRFMPEKLDSDYMKAVESGDVEAQQRMVDEVAKRAGYNEKAYHGSPNKPFWVFDPLRKGERTGSNSALLGYFASSSKDVSSQYRMTESERANAGYRGPLAQNLEDSESQLARAEDIEVFAEYDEEAGGYIGKLKATDQWGSEYTYDADPYDAFQDGNKETVFDDEELAIEAAQDEKDKNIAKAQDSLDAKIAEYEKAAKDKLESSTLHNLYLKLENPLVYDFDGGSFRDKSYSELVQEAVDGGHDGVIMENTNDSIDDDTVSDVFVFFQSSQAKLADPITRDDSGNVIPLSKRFDVGSRDMRYMPEGYKSHHDETLLNSAWNGKELDLNRPFKANESLPSLAMRTKWEEKPLVSKGDFDFNEKARVIFGKNKNGDDVTFKFDPKLLNPPNIVDFADVYTGEQIQYTIADRMSAVDGDMGGTLHPFLKNNDIVIEGPDGQKYVVGWGNNSATVGTKMRRKAKDGANVLMVYLMGNDAHQSNTRTVRLFDTQLENSSKPGHMIDIARAYSYIPIKEIKHASALKEVARIDGLLKKAKTLNKGSDYINKLKSDKNLAIKESQKFKVSAYETELAGIFRKVKSSQTRLDNGIGKQSTVDANIKELSDFASSKKGKSLIGEIPSQFIYEMTGTFDGRKSAVSQISNLKLYDFDGPALSAATADMESGDKNAIVTAIDLSNDQDFFMLYMGDDPKQINAMTSSEKAAAAKLKQNSNFVIHEAYDTLILSPLGGRRNLNSRMENALDAVPDSFQAVLDDRPNVKAQVGKTDAKGKLILSEDNLLNTVRDQQSVPLIYNPRK